MPKWCSQQTAMINKLLIFSLLLISKNICAQYLKIDNGIVLSSFTNKKNLSLLNSKIPNYSFLVGADYLESKWYYLSSQIGYSGLGGKDIDIIIQNEKTSVSERRDYIHLNTTFRAYTKNSGLTFFAGVGPYCNILLGSKTFNNELYSPFYKVKPFHLGTKGEIGLTHTIDKFKIGLMGSYLLSVTPVAKSDYLSLNNNAFSLSFTAGYHIR